MPIVRVMNPRKSFRRKRRSNPILGGGELTLMSNPKRTKHRRRRPSGAVAVHRRRRHSAGARRNPARKNPFTRRRKTHRNPGLGIAGKSPMDLLKVGVGAVAGSIGARGITQAVLQANNVGFVGYGGNLVATWLLAWLTGKFAGPDYAVGVAGGGISATVLRIWSEKVSMTSPAPLAGLGDLDFSSNGLGEYVDSGFPTPSVPTRDTQGMLINNSPIAQAIAAKPLSTAGGPRAVVAGWSAPW